MSALPPKSGHGSARSRCPRCAKSGLMHRSKKSVLFDYLVRDGKHARRNCKTERFCGFEVDDQLEFGGLGEWQVGGVLAALTPHLVIIRPIAHQPASFGLFASGKVAGIR